MTNKYLETLERFRIDPNFWCSEEYFEAAGWETYTSGGSVYVSDSEGHLMLPPIELKTGIVHHCSVPVWSSLPGLSSGEFLDYNFLYMPALFRNLTGGDVAVFRKNSRKFAARHPELTLLYREATPTDDLSALMVSWLEGRERIVQDADVILKYIDSGKNRWVLVDQNGAIYGVNIWDSNHRFVNYRYCFCYPGQFLSEYMRLLFYTHIGDDKLVNDGGCLGDDNLYHFKMKLRPFRVFKVFSLASNGGVYEEG